LPADGSIDAGLRTLPGIKNHADVTPSCQAGHRRHRLPKNALQRDCLILEAELLQFVLQNLSVVGRGSPAEAQTSLPEDARDAFDGLPLLPKELAATDGKLLLKILAAASLDVPAA